MIIVPEAGDNVEWRDYVEKIRKFIAEENRQRPAHNSSIYWHSYAQIAQFDNWPKEDLRMLEDVRMEANQFRIDGSSLRSRVDYHRRCLLGSLGGTPQKLPSYIALQQWINKTWKVSAGVIVKELNEEFFLFEFPSRIEAARIKMGRWSFDERELILESLHVTG